MALIQQIKLNEMEKSEIKKRMKKYGESLPQKHRVRTVSNFISENIRVESKSHLRETFFNLYLGTGWSYITNEEAETIIEGFWDELFKALNSGGIGEVYQLKKIILEKREILQTELQQIPSDVKFDVDWSTRLKTIEKLFNKKIYIIDKFLTIYVVRGKVKKTVTFGEFLFPNDSSMQQIIQSVSKSIHKHGNAKYKSETIELYLSKYINLKELSIEKIRDEACKKCKNEEIKEELSTVSRGTLVNWKERLEYKIKDLKKIRSLFELNK